jgi:hypothetical protein
VRDMSPDAGAPSNEVPELRAMVAELQRQAMESKHQLAQMAKSMRMAEDVVWILVRTAHNR